MAQANAQTFYVTASRGRKECALYTPDKAALAERLPRPGERRAALDALKAAAPVLPAKRGRERDVGLDR